ncbi:MAG TPA: helix-turn-helix domain-containing protein [Tepidisphaeraceae bacterium]
MPAIESPTQAEPLAVDARDAAALLGISESHFFALLRTGRIGPSAISLGRARRYRTEELREWLAAGCPARAKWQTLNGK